MSFVKVMTDEEATSADFLRRARLVADMLGSLRTDVTIDDVREVCPPPDHVNPAIMGRVFLREFGWEPVSYRRSKRGHHRAIAVFRKSA